MARFRGSMQGQRGEASRLGSASSGLLASINGWNMGVHVSAFVDEETGQDCFRVSLTGGSNRSRKIRTIFVAHDCESNPDPVEYIYIPTQKPERRRK